MSKNLLVIPLDLNTIFSYENKECKKVNKTDPKTKRGRRNNTKIAPFTRVILHVVETVLQNEILEEKTATEDVSPIEEIKEDITFYDES
jgi:hypothetical protein